MNFKKQLKEGLLTKNPVLVQLLGMCSTMAITTTLFNGLGMGLSVTIILICSNVLISLLRKVIPGSIRIAAYVVIIAGFVTMVDLLLQAFLPDLSNSLGVFIPLIVVNCIILGRAEAFASKHGVLASAVDGLTQGLGYTAALVIMCLVRELLGSGTFGAGLLNGGQGIRILPEQYPAMLLILPFGGFLTLGCLIAFAQWLTKWLDNRQREKTAKKRKEALPK
ncbi:MAG TPA: electron transport complex subunit E [Candidatus Faecousia faecigallinarum]|nr:electron transport complex subunit E [Candidatus Faecousia faecigallinarum]